MSPEPNAPSNRRPPRQARPTIRNLLGLIRVQETGIAFFATLIGARLAGLGTASLPRVLAVAVSNMTLVVASRAFNDGHDVAEDSINVPHAPIPSGKVRPGDAMAASFSLFAVAIAVAGAGGWLLSVLAAAFTALSCTYTLWLKPIPFLGNALVALLSSYAFWCWMAVAPAIDSTYRILTICLLALCFGREILGTARDHAGDSASGIATVATVYGTAAANRIGVGCIVAGGLLAWLPALGGRANLIYTAMLSCSWLLILFLCARAWFPKVRSASAGMLVGAARGITFLMAVACGFGIERV